ncbi:emp24/gp25L/p24 family/GOLD-domain-containing protein [Catenaria anguillulae PL171]|uniref:Emp24/gp25L/p24 family/GOLD-domain-containing protein n=1 Tax=Catenaria anguillulae PL171 TaxID=765915 RepID=A0A1Y2I047_9FUNG|nr:emp24/gp25L/p24 family/GOLD-domain-containing protein [Catenaria anguillulae PL171]
MQYRRTQVTMILSRSTLASAILLLVTLVPYLASCLTIRVPPYENQCFFEDLVVGQSVTITYQVGDGGNLDIDFWVSDPSQGILHIINKESTGTYTFQPKTEGKYTYCFSNQMSSQHEKTVQFAVFGADKPPSDPKAIVDPVMDVVNELARDIHAIKEEQQFVVIRERQHRDAAEAVNGRVTTWGLFQTAVLVGVCMFQVYYLKHFFEVKRVL